MSSISVSDPFLRAFGVGNVPTSSTINIPSLSGIHPKTNANSFSSSSPKENKNFNSAQLFNLRCHPFPLSSQENDIPSLSSLSLTGQPSLSSLASAVPPLSSMNPLHIGKATTTDVEPSNLLNLATSSLMSLGKVEKDKHNISNPHLTFPHNLQMNANETAKISETSMPINSRIDLAASPSSFASFLLGHSQIQESSKTSSTDYSNLKIAVTASINGMIFQSHDFQFDTPSPDDTVILSRKKRYTEIQSARAGTSC